jgi:hypothetical protein
MKRSQVVMLLAGGTALAGLYACGESGCQPDVAGEPSSFCANRGTGGHVSGFSGASGFGEASSAARGGFGEGGAAHGGGGGE